MVTGADAETETLTYQAPDMSLVPDLDTLRIVPWYKEPTAQVICDCHEAERRAGRLCAARTCCSACSRSMRTRAGGRSWRRSSNSSSRPRTSIPTIRCSRRPGKNGRPQSGRQAYGIDAVNEFDPLFEDVYDYCEAQDIGIDSLIHEEGVAQVEINFNHGDPLALADQTFLFKRTVRQAALRHDIYATFMAKPYEQEPGSAMHIHQSVVEREAARACSRARTARTRALFLAHIAGLQQYLPAAMPMIAPFVNSYRRLVRFLSAPINTHWGHENRTVGLRVPVSDAQNRRVENRVPGADANPYLAIAASLACGYLGMVENLTPTQAMEGNAYESSRYQLPRHILDAVCALPQFFRSQGGAGRGIRLAVQRREGVRARCLSAGDLPLGAPASAAERLTSHAGTLPVGALDYM